jgi:hypothetical protein
MASPIWHKSFFDQVQECQKTNNRFTVHCWNCNLGIVVCMHFRTRCHSKVCLKIREEEGIDENTPQN